MTISKNIQMSEDSLKEHLKAFQDIEDSIKAIEDAEIKENPKRKYMRMKQQNLPFEK